MIGTRHRCSTSRRPGLVGRARAVLLSLVWLLWSPVLLAAEAGPGIRIVPSEDGYFGAWLVSGRIPGSAITMFNPAEVELSQGTPIVKGAWWPPSRVIATPDGALNLLQLLDAGSVKSGYALLYGKLELEAPLKGALLLGAQGPATVYVDGRRVHEHSRGTGRSRGWDAIPLELGAGAHPIVIWLQHPGVAWSVETRLLEHSSSLPPRGARLFLPGASAVDAARLSSQMLVARAEPGLAEHHYRPRVVLSYPRGVPAEADTVVRMNAESDLGAPLYRDLGLGRIGLGPRGVSPFVATLPIVEARELGEWVPERFFVDVDIGAVRRRLVLTLSRHAAELFGRAREKLALAQRGEIPHPETAEVVAATLERRLDELAALGTNPKGDRAEIITQEKSLARLLDKLDSGVNLLQDARGVVEIARRSTATGQAELARLYVPGSYDPRAARRYPLVVLLHGYGGTPRGIMRAFLDSLSLAPNDAVDGFLLAPAAHDDSFYYGPGELDVLGAIDWMTTTYPIDPDRISVTGVSMGGTGTAHLALHNAGRFSAAAPLCGYHSHFTRWDVKGKRLSPWERQRVAHYSTYEWAENGVSLPLYVAHGTEDKPLENSKVLVRRYQKLGYSLKDEWPAWGHSVWEVVYRNQRMWKWLTDKQREQNPERIVIKTDALRYGARSFARIDEFEQWGAAALLDVRRTAPTVVDVGTPSNVRRFTLERRDALAEARNLVVNIGGQEVRFSASEPVTLGKGTDGRWYKWADPPPAPYKVAGVEGPIDDVYLGRLVVSYGTLDPALTRVSRDVARAFASHQLSNARYRVLADRELTPEILESHSVIAVGNEQSHGLLARVARHLPIRARTGELVIGSAKHEGRSLGATFVYPNPEHPHRYVVPVVGTDAAGVLYALSLPKMLPDYIVYDTRINSAAGEQVLGSAEVIDAGFFDAGWQLPKPKAPVAPSTGEPR